MKTIWLAAVTFAVALAMQPSLGAAATIPTVEQSGRLFIGVEQLLATLDLHYDVQAQRLIVGDRTYPGAIVYRGGRHFADMQTLAAFLHLDVNRKGGALALSPRAQTENHSASTAVTGATLSQLRWRLIAVLNDHRRAQGLAPLVADPIASSAAQFQAEDMQRSGVMRHSDSQSHSPLERFMSLGGRAQAYAENVGYCGLDIDGEANQWSAVQRLDAAMMAERGPDAGHRENILTNRYAAVGIGVSVGPHGVYVAEDFVDYGAAQNAAQNMAAGRHSRM